jgi:hypothetical protein
MKKPAREGDEKPAHTDASNGEFSKLEHQYDNASIEERDRLHPDFIRAIHKKRPGLAEETWRALRNGDGLNVTLRHSMKRVLDRHDLSVGRKTNAREDADAAMWLIDELRREDLEPKEMRGHGYELATRTLFIGLRAGLSPEELEKIELHAEIGRKVVSGGKRGGTKSGKTRSRENKPWAAHATELAQVIYAELPGASDEDIAVEIKTRWKLEEVYPPTVRTLATFVLELREGGKLPKRAQ